MFLAEAYVKCFHFSSSTRYIHIHVDFTLLAIGSLTGFPSENYCTCSDNYNDIFFFVCRPSMSGPHLLKKGKEHRKMDVHRDFTVASPAEFVTRFGGNRIIDKVRDMRLCMLFCSFSHNCKKKRI